MIDGQNFFDELARNSLRIYYNIKKKLTGQGHHYTTGYLLDDSYFREHYTLISIDLSKQLALDADAKAIQQTNFFAILDRVGNTTMFIIIEEDLSLIQSQSSDVFCLSEERKCCLLIHNSNLAK